MALTRSQARKYYDRFGKKQDTQAFYEDAALDTLIVYADFENAEAVFEFGCGTGRFAVHLLTSCLSPSATYTGIDLSETMVAIAQQQLSTYVLDLLPKTYIHEAINEAHRVLIPKGKLCLVSLSNGINFSSRLVCAIWNDVFNRRASLVGVSALSLYHHPSAILSS